MTDTNKLKELAEAANRARRQWYTEDDCCWWTGNVDEGDFLAAANPQAILGLLERLKKAEQHWANENSNNMALIAEVERLRGCVQEWERSIGAKAYIDSVMLRDEVERLRTRLEIDERTPYDGIACRDETIKGLDAKCDRLKAENEALRKDAERYRWLRDLPRGTSHGDLSIMLAKKRPAPNQWCTDTIRGESLDAAIDAALEGGSHEHP